MVPPSFAFLPDTYEQKTILEIAHLGDFGFFFLET